MHSIFITGGSGFIGRHVLAALAKANHKLYVLVRSREKLMEAMRGIGWNDFSLITPVQGDLTKPSLGLSSADLQLLLGVDIIIHGGGPMNILLPEKEAEQVFVQPAVEIAGLAKRIHNTNPLKQFIHVVGFKSPYTESNNGHARQASQDQLHSLPPYERMKFQADYIIRQALGESGIPLAIVNPGVVIGDSHTGVTEQVGGLGILVNSVRRKLMPLTPVGDDYWLPLVHVDHVAAFIAALAQEERPINHTYYLLDQKQNTPNIIGLTKLIAKEVRVNGPIGAMPYDFTKKMLNLGAGNMLNMPKESIDFITNADFPVSSKLAIEARHDMDLSVVPASLPFVIADLDYRISHGSLHIPDPFHLNRRANLATIEKEGKGTPIILLHGTFSTSYALLPLARHLAEAKADTPIYIVDLPGFGRSPFHHAPSLLEGYEQSILDLITGIDAKVILAGHSFGGYLAAKMMEKLPDYIQQTILLQPMLAPVSSNYKSSRLTRTLLRWISEASLRKSMVKAQSFAHKDEIPDSYVSYIHEEFRSPRVRAATAEVMAAITRAAQISLHPDSWDADKVSIFWGTQEQDYKIPDAYHRFNMTALPYAHQFPISYPKDTARRILNVMGK
ncbi:alpha/beta fold hydrolase [Paenibacillus pinihumi]|uniref:alpha/beta fold hydrolase n=1 Tax=Paenibacillus pinihumi TaxID=669462 RepID=UPI0004131782|nr:alpha/beta fold hydrolase [Paenibacillus pinihumi]